MHPRDQWFRIYVFTPGKAGPVLVGEAPKDGEPDTRKVQAQWTELPKWERESDMEHVHHPDFYHPDVRVRIAHHREMLKRGTALAACGHEHDPRVRFVETEGKPTHPCADCVRATDAAVGEHEKALAELEANAAEKKRQTQELEKDARDLRVRLLGLDRTATGEPLPAATQDGKVDP